MVLVALPSITPPDSRLMVIGYDPAFPLSSLMIIILGCVAVPDCTSSVLITAALAAESEVNATM